MNRSAIYVTAVLSIALVACSSGGGSLPVPPTEYGDDYAEAICLLEVRCGVLQDEARCQTTTKLELGLGVLGAQITSDAAKGTISYNALNAGICVDTLAALSCNDVTLTRFGDVPSVCNSVTHGTVAEGGDCYLGIECATGLCNLNGCTGASCCVGTCGPAQITVPAGNTCGDGTHVCDQFSFCNSNVCAAYFTLGTACTSTSECQAGLTCTDAACTALPQLGDMCTTTDGCAGLGNACDPNQLMCIKMVGLGQSCAMAPCKTDLQCDPSSMLCVSTMAPTLNANGVGCSSGAQCASGYCDGSSGTTVCATAPVCGA